MCALKTGDPFPITLSSDQTEFPACHLNVSTLHLSSPALVSIRKLQQEMLKRVTGLTLNLPLSFGVGDGLPEMEFVELLGMKQTSLGVSWDLGHGWDTKTSDYIRIKYVALSFLGRCLHIHW